MAVSRYSKQFLLSFTLLTLSFSGFAASVHHHLKGYPDYPKVNYGSGKQATIIKRGEYLVKAGDCIACHTREDASKPFSGGLGVKTPFGTIYSPNITPDKKTGIGNWTEKEFINAMRNGIAPDGSYYFPVFPYPAFNKISTDDLRAIFAYLKALPPIENKNKPVDMAWPFRWRFAQLGWRILFFQFHKGQFKPDPKKSTEWNRGAYLVQGLGHCGMCHTPLNMLGAIKRKYYLKGGFIDGFHAPDISSSALKNVPISKILKVFKQDHLIEGGRVVGPMAQVNHDSLEYMTDKDLKAIATYLKTVKSAPLPKRKAATTVSVEVGKKIYADYCASCHTTGAGGAPKIGVTADWADRIKLGINTLTGYAIKGIRGMPPKGTCTTCSNAEIQSAVEYMIKDAKSDSGQAAKAAVKQPTKSLAEGKKIYDQVCSICHADGKLGAPKFGDKQAWAPRIEKGLDTLFDHTINGYNKMPVKGACNDCTNAQLIAAVKYMVQNSKTKGDYSLW